MNTLLPNSAIAASSCHSIMQSIGMVSPLLVCMLDARRVNNRL